MTPEPIPAFDTLRLATTKTGSGKVYVLAYKGKWDSSKKQVRTEYKEYIGALDTETGRVRPTPHFLSRHPEMAGKIFYYADNRLIEKNPNETTESPNMTPTKYPEYAQELNFGASWACWQTARSHGILKDLKEVFGDDGESILKIAIYWYLTGGSMDAFADWQCETWLPKSKLLTGQRISELLAKVDKPLMTKYFKLRFQHNLESNDEKKAAQSSRNHKTSNTNKDKTSTEPSLPPPKRYLALDSTSISTYSQTITEASFGYAKQNPELKQVNLTIAVDFITGDVVYAYVSEGSITDKALFNSILLELKAAGFDLDRIVLVTDRGYASLWNIQSLINSEVSYISAVPVVEKSIRDKFIKYELSFGDPALWLKGIPMAARTFDENFVQSTDFGGIRIKGWLHLYKKPGKGETEMSNFTATLDNVIDRKNQGEKIAADEWKQYASYVIEENGVYKRNLDEIRKKIALEGTLALRSNCVKDPKICLIAYRERNQVENGFWHLKVGNGSNRLHTTEATYLGKIFMYIIAQSIRIVHSTNARRNQTDQLKIPGDSLDRVLDVLNKVEVRRYGAGKNWLLQPVPKKARNCLALLGIEEKLPRRVAMF